MKTALIIGTTGQDGAYLSKLLLDKGYEVHGMKRRSSSINTSRINKFYHDPKIDHTNFYLHYGDLTDVSSMVHVIQKVQPDEVYNLGAMSHVKISFEVPEYTAEVDAVGSLRLLETLRALGLANTVRFYQASSSEMFGMVQETPQRETTPFYPRSPYGVAKVYSYWIVKNYREAYGIFASNGILFNHESPLRGENFVTRKITRGLAQIAVGTRSVLMLGNLEARRDWGHAKDYVYAMWKMMQHDQPDDFVVATNEHHSIREFIEMAATKTGLGIEWSGTGFDEKATVTEVRSPDLTPAVKPGMDIIKVHPDYFRPTEVDTLLGDASKAKKILGWTPKISFDELVQEMIEYDLDIAGAEKSIQDYRQLQHRYP